MPTSVINQNGLLPLSVNVAPEITGMAVLTVAGSVWTSRANTMVGMEVVFEGQVISTAMNFSSGPTTHRPAALPGGAGQAVDQRGARDLQSEAAGNERGHGGGQGQPTR